MDQCRLEKSKSTTTTTNLTMGSVVELRGGNNDDGRAIRICVVSSVVCLWLRVCTYDPFDLKMSEQPTMSCCVSTVLPDGQTKGRRLLTEIRRTEQKQKKIYI